MESFSQKTKEELIRRFPKKKCCVKAEIAAIVRANGTLHLRANRSFVLSISSENASLMRKVHQLLKVGFELQSQLVIEETEKLGRRCYKLQLTGAKTVKRVLGEMDIISSDFDFDSGVPSTLVRTKCCQAAFLRGAFLARGSVTDPQKGNYHLEIVSENEEFAQGLTYLMNLCKFKAGLSQRREYKEYVVYLKEAEAISNFLTFIGAHSALLFMEDVRIIKEMRNEVNRLVNCETANLEKSVRAAVEQVEIITEFMKKKEYKNLPNNLKDLAALRLENPGASLRELGQLANPALSKSAVNHRMRKLLKIAKTYME